MSNELTPVFFVSRIDSGKGWDVLLKALHLLKNTKPDVAFKGTLADCDDQVDSLARTTGELGLEADVNSVGPVRQAELPPIYRNFDVFAFPTEREESLGLVGLEAMACGIPVIGSNKARLPGYIRNGESGYLFEPGNYRELADQIEMFYNLTETKRWSLSRQAVKTARSYDSVRVYNELSKKIQEVTK